MSDHTQQEARSPAGRFAPGQSGHPAARAAGWRNAATLSIERLLGGEAEGITRKAIALALDGDAQILRLCLERIAPKRKDGPISFALPPIERVEDVEQASAALLAAVAAGEVTPGEAGNFMQLLVSHHGLCDAVAFSRQLALESPDDEL